MPGKAANVIPSVDQAIADVKQMRADARKKLAQIRKDLKQDSGPTACGKEAWFERV